MAFSRFHTGMAVRTAALFLTIVAIAWMMTHTQWYVTITLCIAAVVVELAVLTQFATRSSREVARFLDAISFDDTTQSFPALGRDSAHRELGDAMTRVLDMLRMGRSEHEEQRRYLQILVAHVPVALLSVDEQDRVELLNSAARRLFETPVARTAQFARYGQAFSVGLESVHSGGTAILKMERTSGYLQLKAASTELTLRGVRRRLISLQNIESEMSAQELAAWQTVIRVMAHEVMNSLTPVSSLSATAYQRVQAVLAQMPEGDPRTAGLRDACEALEAVSRRSEGLLHFVHNHRRLTKRLVTQLQVTPIQRVFARLQRLLANDLAARDVELTTSVEWDVPEIAVDAELLDQALINLVRNAMEALRDTPAGRIVLSAYRDADSRVTIAVSDNGPGIPTDLRDRIFVPFFTTKRQGNGIGLTLVRQIATAHGATVYVTETPGGGATVGLRF